MTVTRVLAIALVAASAAACGGGAKPAALHVSISALETKAAMTGCSASTQPFATAIAQCTYGSGTVTVATFDTNSHRDLWILASKTAEGGIIVKGNGWAASTFDQDDQTSLAAVLGGTPG